MKTLSIIFACAVAHAALAQDAAQKLNRFRSETNLPARTGMSGELVLNGGNAAFFEFKRSLFDTNLAGKQLNFKERVYMLGLVASLGYLAATSDVVRDFLVEGTSPQFWKTNILWKTDLGDDEHSVLAGRALNALALSGRIEFAAVSQKLQQDLATRRNSYLASALVDAHFRKQLIQKLNWESYHKLSVDETMQEFREWKQTPTGSNWVQWSRPVELPER